MKNIDVRVAVSDSGVKYKDVAKRLHITPEWLSAIMREDLSEFNRARILNAVQELKEGAADD